MSHILVKQVQGSLMSSSPADYVKIFSNTEDNGYIYTIDDNGNLSLLNNVSGANTLTYEEKTYADLYTMYTGQSFATGSYYLITDFESIYDQPDFYMDGTPKTVLINKSKPVGWSYQPILVRAISSSELDPIAYQPVTGSGYPKDSIKYDISKDRTELGNPTKGRITERIDEFGNKTDYDHRSIRFKRYQTYEKNTQLTGTISDWDCVSGQVNGDAFTLFTSELSVGDIIMIDTFFSLGYYIYLKVDSITSNNNFIAQVESAYVGSVPSSVLMDNGMFILPQDYTFISQSFNFYSTIATGKYESPKEVYFGQGDDGDYDDEVYTFSFNYEISNYSGIKTFNNTVGNYSRYYDNSLSDNALILSNNTFGHTSTNNKLSDYSYNNNIGNLSSNNKINDSSFYLNQIGNLFQNNQIYSLFVNNVIEDSFSYNQSFSSFSSNLVGTNFQYNTIKSVVIAQDFTGSTLVYGGYNCEIFQNSNGDTRLSYFNSFDSLTVTDITD